MDRELRVLTLEQAEEWDGIVKSFSNHDVYYLSGYVKAFEIHGDGQPLLLYYKENDKARGINVVMKRDIADAPHFKGILSAGQYFDLSTPYGYGGWLIEEDREGKTGRLFIEYEKWCRENKIISEFVRFHPLIGNQKGCEKDYEIVGLGETVTMDISSFDIIWENIISKNRNMIRKAQKNGVKIYNGRFPEIYKVFKEIYDKTMDKDNADEYYYFESDFYKSVLEDLGYNAQVFYAMYEEKVIAAAIMLMEEDKMNYHLSCSIKEYANMAPTNLLLYEAARWGCVNGYKTLYLGGGVGSGEDGLFKFKRAFYKGELKRFYIGKRVFDENKYEELAEIRERENPEIRSSTYFPVYWAD